VRTLIAQACRELKDEENACLELAAALEAFERLGASKDLSRVRALLPRDAHQSGGGLTAREIQVLRHVASGMTNRPIAGKLKISEKTVARHLSNIFTKLDLSSRTAAAAYAYDRKLV
jgi:DNA-binding NarL/FixJ family response regulator